MFFGFSNSVWVRNWELKTQVLKPLILVQTWDSLIFEFRFFLAIADCYSTRLRSQTQSLNFFSVFIGNCWENPKLKYEVNLRFEASKHEKEITQTWNAEYPVNFNRPTIHRKYLRKGCVRPWINVPFSTFCRLYIIPIGAYCANLILLKKIQSV